MMIDVPGSPAVPTPLEGVSLQECLEARDHDDNCSHTLEESIDQNPPHDSDPNEDELLGPLSDISIPGGHTDDSIALIVPLGGDDL